MDNSVVNETAPRTLVYDYSAAKAWCEEHKLLWDQKGAELADALFAELGLTQEQAPRLMCHHAYRVHRLFTPEAYRWPTRLFLAAYFLLGQLFTKLFR